MFPLTLTVHGLFIANGAVPQPRRDDYSGPGREFVAPQDDVTDNVLMMQCTCPPSAASGPAIRD
jgi:hypothetical protein